MYPITNEVKALFEAEQRKVLRITGTDKNGAVISITGNDVIADSFQVDRYSCNGEKLEVGTAIAAQMSLTLENGGGQYNGIVFEGAELFVEVGIADWTQSSPTITYVPCGYFTPDEQPRRLSTISITGLDRMTKFDVVVDAAALTFPATIAGLVGQVCTLCGVTLAQSISGLVNAGVNVAELPTAQEEITYRNLIQWCAGVMGTNAWFDWNGQLRFSWYANATGYVSTVDNRYSSDLYEDDLTVSGVEYTNDSGIVIVEGTDDYAIDLTGNAIMGPLVATVLPALNTALNGFTYRPFTAATVNAPYLWPMDIVTFTDKDGNNHTSVLTNVAFGLNGTTAMESKGMTYAINKLAQPKGFTREQAQLVSQAMDHVEQYIDESLTQQEIFNRLTDDGAAQGLLLYNGQLYVNASYIQTGTLVANLIKAGVLGDLAGKNYWNMETGEFSLSATTTVGGSTVEDIAQSEAEQAVEDFDDTLTQQDVFNRLTNDGAAQGIVLSNGQLYINASYIQSGTLVLGGVNNQNGALRVLNAAGQEIGTWTKDGISISEGKINLSRTELGVTYSVKIWDNALYPIMVDYSGNNHDYRTTIGGITPLIVRNNNDAHGFYVTPKSLNLYGQNGLPWFSVNKTDNTSGDDEYRLILGQYSVGDVLAEIYGDLKVRGDVSLFNPLSVGNGGTNATTPAQARANLEITPANIGAVAKTGDIITGNLGFAYANMLSYGEQTTRRWLLYPNGDLSVFYLATQELVNGEWANWRGVITAHTDGSIEINQPLGTDQGGTGARTPAQARTNLEITPANIGAVAKSGDTMTGTLKWASGTALPAASSLQYFLGIDAFADGGTTHYITAANLLAAIGAVAKSGDTMTGTLKTTAGTGINVAPSGARAYIYLSPQGDYASDVRFQCAGFAKWSLSSRDSSADYFFGLFNHTTGIWTARFFKDDTIQFAKPLPVGSGGTGATTAAGARTNLGTSLYISSNTSATVYNQLNALNTSEAITAMLTETAAKYLSGNKVTHAVDGVIRKANATSYVFAMFDGYGYAYRWQATVTASGATVGNCYRFTGTQI